MRHRLNAFGVASLLLLRFPGGALAQEAAEPQDSLWTPVVEPAEITAGTAAFGFRAPSLRFDRLNEPLLAAILALAPVDTGATALEPGVEIKLPVPIRMLRRRDGRYERFRVVESPLVPAELVPHLGGMKTYSGTGIDDPTLTTRFTLTSAGLNGMVISPDGTWILEPAPNAAVPGKDLKGTHATIFKEDIHTGHRHRIPTTRATDANVALLGAPARPRFIPLPSVPPERRTFRIAVAATPGYTDYHRRRAGPLTAEAARDTALVAIVQTINLVQALYERELGIRFEFVPKQREIIFVSQDGGYPGEDVTPDLLAHNQAVLDRIVGSGNYDLGHVFTKSDGGMGAIASVCEEGRKARGGTGWIDPTAEKYFAIDFVAHEMGHQLNGRHTFNSARGGSCTARSRAMEDAFEPGSGTTVMGYAGICKDDRYDSNVEAESDQYFHAGSLQRMVDNLHYINVHYPACGRRAPTGNSPPQVSAPASWVIPASTPFVLHASGSDPDGDSLTYTWEEYYPDEQWTPAASPPDGADVTGLRPSFRSYPPSRNPWRTLPRLEYLMYGERLSYERLPITDRNTPRDRPLNFRVTARDTRGAFATADVAVHVVATVNGEPVDPFRVRKPAAGTPVIRGADLEVRWSMENTNVPPIQCTEVRILLATDRSRGFADTLAAQTPNDGRELVRIPPGAPTPEAWVRIECVGNIFFTVSEAFQIRP